MGLETLTRPSIIDGQDIPEPKLMDGWKGVEIKESGQPLVCLNDLDPLLRIAVSPQYFLRGIPKALDKLYLRQEALERLVSAAKGLPQGLKLVVLDAYRPISVQEEIFRDFKERLRAANPLLEEELLTRMAERYVSLPSNDPAKPSPHATGGAIDLSVARENGAMLPMGSEWDSFEQHSQTAHFRNGVPSNYHQNRRVLYTTMTQVGFTNYPEEWWHYDFGNQFWGFLSGNTAIYGIASGGGVINE